jgi:hypothetical protein
MLKYTLYLFLGNEETAEMIRKEGGKAFTYTVDVSNK